MVPIQGAFEKDINEYMISQSNSFINASSSLTTHFTLDSENTDGYANGRIVFTNNRSLVGVGYDRTTWENEVKGAPAGKKFYRTITDDTMPGGPIERTIEYVAPFDRCDREKDYETTWNFFKMKYGGIQ